MPHSTISDLVDASNQLDEDEVLSDAPAQTLDGLKEEDCENINDDASKIYSITNQASKADVKLEDLFNDDDDDDDEFSSSGATTAKVESSPPAAPL